MCDGYVSVCTWINVCDGQMDIPGGCMDGNTSRDGCKMDDGYQDESIMDIDE